ncbi:MAG: ISNCY family transposase [Nannocystaceae bacterium]|nr:ISNCY family transposase [Nannocystaceae bacterium]
MSRETLRKWLIEAEIWLPRKLRRRVHQPRNRRECYGELVQIDGSDHRWFEDRGPRCTLLVYIDDATSELMELHFCVSESAFSYFESTKSYLRRHGKPVAFYSDKASVFRVSEKKNQTFVKAPLTQFGRAMSDLNIDIICANTSQAKGRVERANLTLQDRLVKELPFESQGLEMPPPRSPANIASRHPSGASVDDEPQRCIRAA